MILVQNCATSPKSLFLLKTCISSQLIAPDCHCMWFVDGWAKDTMAFL